MEDKKFAVLIDSENIAAKYLVCILSEMTKYGNVTYKRIYGDWTNPRSARWRMELMENSILPIQQFPNTVGKNATDSALIIDAMDILYTNTVDGFCLVSSDGDFTRLASRLKESGMQVIGMGERKTPQSFRAACTVFTNLELLQSDEQQQRKSDTKTIKPSEVANIIIEIITENVNKGRKTSMGEIGVQLQKRYTDFDIRRYGYSSLSTFIDELKGFDITREDGTIYVQIKENKDMKKSVMAYAFECISKAGGRGLSIGELGQKIHMQYPTFKVKEYGYSGLYKFISAIPKVKIRMENDNKQVAYLKGKK